MSPHLKLLQDWAPLWKIQEIWLVSLRLADTRVHLIHGALTRATLSPTADALALQSDQTQEMRNDGLERP